jgi:4-hydroxythreonine-4-phosphate dehydrogenase
MGDPAGIGPEIVVRALGDDVVRSTCAPIVVGDPGILARAAALVQSGLRVRTVQAIHGAGTDPQTLDVVEAPQLQVAADALTPGTLDARWGHAAAACCRAAVALARSGEVSAIVSTPFNKQAFRMAGYTAMDDMMFFQECFADGEAYMVGEVGGLWVIPVTFHVAFRAIPDLITREAVLGKIRQLHGVMRAAAVSPLRLGVAGLNVHSGEGGMFGREEIESIRPAIEAARAEGLTVSGPVPPDSIFPNALRGDYPGLVCMYHDQANIARKILGRDSPGVGMYLGMPVPVVSTPHGTAYDIAWKGMARHTMMVRAITTAAALARPAA